MARGKIGRNGWRRGLKLEGNKKMNEHFWMEN